MRNHYLLRPSPEGRRDETQRRALRVEVKKFQSWQRYMPLSTVPLVKLVRLLAQ